MVAIVLYYDLIVAFLLMINDTIPFYNRWVRAMFLRVPTG